jgi:hypothetical protein
MTTPLSYQVEVTTAFEVNTGLKMALLRLLKSGMFPVTLGYYSTEAIVIKILMGASS